MVVTMDDIARETRVSLATVSRVLNNTPHPISEKTRKKVLGVAQRLGYIPNLHARSLATRTNTVIELFLDLSFDAAGETGFGSFIRQVLLAIQREAETAGYSVIVDIGHSAGHGVETTRTASVPIAGGLVLSPREGDRNIPLLAEKGIPFVVIGSTEYREHCYVDTDNVAGATLAVEHLIGLGHERIACLGGPTNYRPSLDRLAGFRRALRTHGLSERREWVLTGEWSWENGFDMMGRILEMEEEAAWPTAVFAANDMLASGAIRAIKSRGLSVPGQFSVIGFDDLPSSSLIDPPLTTVRQPIFEMARLATKKLIEVVESGEMPNPPYQDLIIPELMERDSCARQPKK